MNYNLGVIASIPQFLNFQMIRRINDILLIFMCRVMRLYINPP